MRAPAFFRLIYGTAFFYSFKRAYPTALQITTAPPPGLRATMEARLVPACGGIEAALLVRSHTAHDRVQQGEKIGSQPITPPKMMSAA